MKRLGFALLCATLSLGLVITAQAYEAFKGPLGVIQKRDGVSNGYVIFAPQDSKKTYLIDNDGDVINEWTSEHNGFFAEMLPNGNMVRQSRLDGAQPSSFGGTSGLIEEFDWSGKKVWEYKMYTPEKEVSHHTFEVMPNGNYLLLGWEYKSYQEAIDKGLDPNKKGRTIFPDGLKQNYDGYVVQGIWPDFIREVDHAGKTVWEWHVWDHVGTGKDKLDINVFIPPQVDRVYAGPDWTHFNGVAYNAATDEICVTSRNLAEVYVIDKKSGKITYRWGNPANYGEGRYPGGLADDGDQKLFGPHAPDWTPQGTISILDNGTQRPSNNYTRAVELDHKADKVIWEWKPRDVKAQEGNFLSSYQCGAQKLANGNWLITSTYHGHVIEVKPDKHIVWEFISPVVKDQVYRTSSPHGKANDPIHKAVRYPADYPGFKGKDMKPRYALPNWVDVLSDNPAPMTPM